MNCSGLPINTQETHAEQQMRTDLCTRAVAQPGHLDAPQEPGGCYTTERHTGPAGTGSSEMKSALRQIFAWPEA